jgi:hypothetical protein
LRGRRGEQRVAMARAVGRADTDVRSVNSSDVTA